ncbi:MAG: bifunctional aspartate kinase/homoserine dehydrogenase I [Ignavibacteriales bacterium]|nr:bifunctional aspartate kinase/homoserine dehydrogenase I [Ignavibacteriales bacterium]
MKVLKFGGSSVASPKVIKQVANIILSTSKKVPKGFPREKIIVVVSAFQGVTNQLLECASLSEKGNETYQSLFRTIAKKHLDTFDSLVGKRNSARKDVEKMLFDLKDILHGINLLRDCPPRTLDATASFGERLSAFIISEFLKTKTTSCYVDTREIIVTDDQFTHANILFEQTNKKTQKYFSQLFAKRKNVIPIVTGFIASTEDGRTTTIGRNGSDYTAAIIGAAVKASSIEIWTDVDGVLSADPRAVKSAFVLPQMSYEEAMELSYFGAKVLHSATIAPAVAENIPIVIKNTFNPSAPGTVISKIAQPLDDVAKGITSVDDCALFTLRGLSMVGVPGTAERLFRTLASHNVNVILISQASSEHTICFAVTTNDAAKVRKAIGKEFHLELQNKLTALDEKPSQTIVAIVGEGMKGTPGVSGKVFQSLGQNNVNISAIAQGASERNISFVIDAKNKTRALNVIHQAFFEKRKRLSLVVVGVGNIGNELLHQLKQQQAFLLSRGFEVKLCGVANSKHFILSQEGISLEHWREKLEHSHLIMNPNELALQCKELEFVNAALVDCTASQEFVDAYPQFLEANMHIVTPNKKANVLPWKRYTDLMSKIKQRQKYFLFETNVGAGLPIISTLQDFVVSGDKVLKIEGMFSGTLGYLFNTFDGSVPFSALLSDAHKRGYTEPDPRDDLSGMDVARKLLILARLMRHQFDLKNVKVENLVPNQLQKEKYSPNFFSRFAKFDSLFQKKLEAAQKRNAVLRYVGIVEKGKAYAQLKEYPRTHLFASSKGSDNIFAFTTKRYSDSPLVVQGPGAGPEVTAMGVFSDILKLLNYLPY